MVCCEINNIIFELKTYKKYVYITIIVYGMQADKQTNTYSHASMLHFRKMIASSFWKDNAFNWRIGK